MSDDDEAHRTRRMRRAAAEKRAAAVPTPEELMLRESTKGFLKDPSAEPTPMEQLIQQAVADNSRAVELEDKIVKLIQKNNVLEEKLHDLNNMYRASQEARLVLYAKYVELLEELRNE